MKQLSEYRDAVLKAIANLPADCRDGNLDPAIVRAAVVSEYIKIAWLKEVA